jgi:hypothetical protein
VPVDPDVAAVILAVALGAVPGLYITRRAIAERRRARRFCVACGRRLISGLPTCDC